MRIFRLVALAFIPLAAGCGTTEKSGSVGDELSAEGLDVTLLEVDQKPPRPKHDITGLSLPADGYKLVGVRVKVCNDSGAAINQAAFSVESTKGKGRPKFTARNYRDDYEAVRDGCDDGWMVFEVPEEARAEKVKFDYEDTGQGGPGGDDGFHAKFEWKV